MKTIEVNVYEYSELSDKAKVKAREWAYAVQDEWRACTYEDAAQAGLTLDGFDTDSASFVRDVQGDFLTSAPECAGYILSNHGAHCETHKAALFYQAKLKAIGESPDGGGEARETWDAMRVEAGGAFLIDLLQCYKRLLQEQLEYTASEEYLADFIEANGYTFTEDGKRFG
jgi:hypothetical protein